MTRRHGRPGGTSVSRSAAGVTCLIVGLCLALPSVRHGAAQAQEAPRAVAFAIAPQPLASALMAFGRQAGLQVVVDAPAVAGLSSAGVSGSMTAERALQQLLQGSGLVYRFTGAGAVAVERPGASAPSGAVLLDPVQVQGVFPVPPQAMIDNIPPAYAGGQVATGGQLGLLGNRSVMDTPFNQTSYTAKKAQDQQARTVRDVLVDDPSVRFTIPPGSAGGDNITIRGFPVSIQNASYGGLFGMLPPWTIAAELAERVEVLKGPSAMLNGMPTSGANSIGGTVNVVPKRAPAEPLTQVTASYASAGQFGGHVDVARRFGGDGQFGARLNGVFRGGQTAVQNNNDQLGLAVLGLDFRGERVRLSADLGYQYNYVGWLVPYLGVNPGVPLPWAPDARANLGQPWGYKETKDLFGVFRAEADVTEHVTVYAAFGVHDFRWNALYSAGLTATGPYGAATASAPLNLPQYRTYLTGAAGLRALVDTGPIGHDFALTASTFANENGEAFTQGAAFATNFYNPAIISRPNLATPVANKTSTQNLSSFGIADTLSAADKRVQLTVGGRLQQVASANFNVTTGAQTSSYDQSAFSPSVALVLKPFWENVTFYANWIQGLQPGIIVQAPFLNAGEVFPPYKSTQYEAGIKVDWGRFTTTASLFQISRPSVLTDVAANTQFLGGEQRNQGLELNVFGEPVEGVRLLGGLMLMNAVLAKTQGGLTDGWIAPFSPGVNLNLAGEWDLPFARGLTLNGRLVYTGAQYIDTTWPRRVLPDWTRVDLGLRYAFDNPAARGKLLVARLDVENVLDADYWAGGTGATTMFLGAPRTFRLSLTADF